MNYSQGGIDRFLSLVRFFSVLATPDGCETIRKQADFIPRLLNAKIMHVKGISCIYIKL